jgi:hypothetical protein
MQQKTALNSVESKRFIWGKKATFLMGEEVRRKSERTNFERFHGTEHSMQKYDNEVASLPYMQPLP